jgi:hypothetical protein
MPDLSSAFFNHSLAFWQTVCSRTIFCWLCPSPGIGCFSKVLLMQSYNSKPVLGCQKGSRLWRACCWGTDMYTHCHLFMFKSAILSLTDNQKPGHPSPGAERTSPNSLSGTCSGGPWLSLPFCGPLFITPSQGFRTELLKRECDKGKIFVFVLFCFCFVLLGPTP